MYAFLRNNIFSISLGTTLSKFAGFIRQTFIAALFGVGLAYDAYNYAYIIPGFIIIIIGGINGPLHNSIVAVLTPIEEKRASQILQNIMIKIILFLSILGLLIFLNAELIINIIGPNLSNETQIVAAKQLQILSPCIPLSGFIGLSYGALNSKNKFFISSISPAIVSIVTIILITIYWFLNHINHFYNNYLYEELIPIATLLGTFIQTIIQLSETYRIGLFQFKFNLKKKFIEESRILNLIIPASFASGLGQINVFVDMFFASSFKGAASGLAYGNFLIQAPLGILSNALILPILPKFSKLINKKNSQELYKVLIAGIENCFLATFLMMGFFISFNDQIVNIVYQRGAFNIQAGVIVKNILIAYSIGLPAYLLKDLLVRTYYSIEQANLPFKLSLYGIALNVFFDWILIGAPIINSINLSPYNFGVVGLVISSGIVNIIICIVLSIKLRNHIKALPHTFLIRKIILLMISCTLAMLVSHNIGNNYESSASELYKFARFLSEIILYIFSYFLFTKFFKVNKIELKLLKNLIK